MKFGFWFKYFTTKLHFSPMCSFWLKNIRHIFDKSGFVRYFWKNSMLIFLSFKSANYFQKELEPEQKVKFEMMNKDKRKRLNTSWGDTFDGEMFLPVLAQKLIDVLSISRFCYPCKKNWTRKLFFGTFFISKLTFLISRVSMRMSPSLESYSCMKKLQNLHVNI